MKRFWRDNSLSIAVFTLFAAFMVGQTLAGFEVYNENRVEHGEQRRFAVVGVSSERRFPRSHDGKLGKRVSADVGVRAADRLPASARLRGIQADRTRKSRWTAIQRLSRRKKDAPWPVRRGGIILRLYEYSLTLAFFLLFVLSFALHAVGGMRESQ